MITLLVGKSRARAGTPGGTAWSGLARHAGPRPGVDCGSVRGVPDVLRVRRREFLGTEQRSAASLAGRHRFRHRDRLGQSSAAAVRKTAPCKPLPPPAIFRFSHDRLNAVLASSRSPSEARDRSTQPPTPTFPDSITPAHRQPAALSRHNPSDRPAVLATSRSPSEVPGRSAAFPTDHPPSPTTAARSPHSPQCRDNPSGRPAGPHVCDPLNRIEV